MKPADYAFGHGDDRFDVTHYDLDLACNVTTNRLTARAELTCVALADLPEFELDLHSLKADKVLVDGAAPAKVTHKAAKLKVKPAKPLRAGRTFTVVVKYSGKPRPVPGLFGGAGWEELTDGILVTSQPYGAPSWFPCNDRPGNKAGYRVTVKYAGSYWASGNGAVVEHVARGGQHRWVFEQPEPMPTYLAALHIGVGVARPVPSESAVPVEIVHPPLVNVGAGSAFERQGEMVTVFEELFGPYPFGGYRAVVTEDALEIPLEAQGMSIFGANHAAAGWANERLVAHELAHQWFGNSVTVGHWRDIWLHEGFACYAEWLWSEASGGRTAASHAEEHWRRLSGLGVPGPLVDPGPGRMFDDWIYKRGALTLHALRARVADKAFFTILREWGTRHRFGVVTTQDFTALAEEVSGQELTAQFDAWLFSKKLPALG
ncbi:M1 family metallopeptidase [Tessaracoccus lubricantis]|uniref:Aminopeptidase N n=1 Tax=Tessaracoccus lubricantis TaxID=545543 RepID=A0ABP9EXV4_9ACTN